MTSVPDLAPRLRPQYNALMPCQTLTLTGHRTQGLSHEHAAVQNCPAKAQVTLLTNELILISTLNKAQRNWPLYLILNTTVTKAKR